MQYGNLIIIYNINLQYIKHIITDQIFIQFFPNLNIILTELNNNNTKCFSNILNINFKDINDKFIFLVNNFNNDDNIIRFCNIWNNHQEQLKNTIIEIQTKKLIINDQQNIDFLHKFESLSKIFNKKLQLNILSHCTLTYTQMEKKTYLVEIFNVCKSFIQNIRGIGSFFMIKVLFYIISQNFIELVWLGVKLDDNSYFEKALKAYARSGFNNPYISKQSLTQSYPYYFLNLNFRILKKNGKKNGNDIQILEYLYNNSLEFIKNNNIPLGPQLQIQIDTVIIKATYLKKQYGMTKFKDNNLKQICHSYIQFDSDLIDFIYNIYISEDKEISGSLNSNKIFYTLTIDDYIHSLNIYKTNKLIQRFEEITKYFPNQTIKKIDNGQVIIIESDPTKPYAVATPESNITYHIHPINLYLDPEFGKISYNQSFENPLIIAPPSKADLHSYIRNLFYTNLVGNSAFHIYKNMENIEDESDIIFKVRYIFCLEGIYQIGFSKYFLNIFYNIIIKHPLFIDILLKNLQKFIHIDCYNLYEFDSFFEKGSLFATWFNNDNLNKQFKNFASYWCHLLNQKKFTSINYPTLSNISIFDIQFISWLEYGRKIQTSEDYLGDKYILTYDTKQLLKTYWHDTKEILPIGSGGYPKSMIKLITNDKKHDESDENSMDIIIEIYTIEQPTMDVDENINNQLFTVNFVSDNNFNCFLNSLNRKNIIESYK